MRGRLLGLDVGEKRIGLAISDPEGRVAVPLCTVERGKADFAQIEEVVKSEEVTAVVVGLPLSLLGGEGRQAARARRFAERLGRRLGLPVHLWDERLSSVAAARQPLVGRRGRRPPIDEVAAALVLQGYLDRRKDAGA
jgi:putative Holliday junction resolvase